MKICMLTTGFPRFQGDLFGSFILELAKALVRQGEEVLVIAPHQAGLPGSDHLEGVEIRRFRYFYPARWQCVAYGGGIPTNVRRSWMVRLQLPFFLIGFFWAARRAAGQSQLVHCHWTATGLVARWALGKKCGLVLSVRGSDMHLLEKGVLQWLNRRIYGWMDHIVAVSEDIASKLAVAGVDRDKIRVVYNGVDERFQAGDKEEKRRQLDLPTERFIVLFIGLLVPVKGLDLLLRALADLQDEPLLCALVGDGPLLEELQTEVQRLQLAGRVVFYGRRPTAEIPAWLNAADVLVLPSRSEGRPNVVLEAQACGLPVIATRVGGTPELIRHGENGLLIDSEDAGALARELARLMSNSAYREQLGRAARQSIERSGQTWAATARQMQEIYREVVETA